MTPTARPAARTLPVGRVLGVPVDIAPSWLLFFGLVVVLYGPTLGEREGSLGGYLAAAAFAVLLLGSVLLHEVGHCVAARLLRLRVRRITVSFLAGLTEITDPPPTPGRAFAVSGAGPLVSVLLAAAGFAGLALLPDVGSTGRTVVGLFALSNAGLAVFNLLPGLPLDGGGLLRALVWRLSGDPSTGTVVSAHAGRVLALAVLPLTALVLPAAGVRLSPVGLVISAVVAVFLFAGATASLRAARAERRLRGLDAGTLSRPALAVPASLPLDELLRRAHEARLYAVVVVDDAGRPAAVVSEVAVQAVPPHRLPWMTVGDVARPLGDGLLLRPELTGAELVEAVRRSPATEYVVATTPPRVLVANDLARAAGGAEPAVA